MTDPRILIQGPSARLSGFTRVNRELARHLSKLGWHVRVFATDETTARVPRERPPDVYLFHGHPYDLTNAPGRLNVFFLSYDYARFVPADRWLAARLNAHFDLLLVPSTFSRAAAIRSGVHIPIEVCAYGVDCREFHPPRKDRDPERPFTFLALGGATERKGTDVVVTAFAREFRGDPAVRLHIKAFSYHHLLPWMRRVLARVGAGREQIVLEHGDAANVGAYFRQADAGLFPFRGEGFGLPILECLASGTPALVTRGGGPLDYARGANWIRARAVVRHGKHQLEPDHAHLQHLMRQAVTRGPITNEARRALADMASTHSWARTAERVDDVLRNALANVGVAASTRALSQTPSTGQARRSGIVEQPRVAHVYGETGRISWKHRNGRVGQSLRATASVRAHPWRGTRFDGDADVVVGQSDFCLEALQISSQRRPEALKIVYRESGPPESMLASGNDERQRCGAPPLGVSPMSLWRHAQECRLADRIVVWSRAAEARFMEAGYPRNKLRVIPPGVDLLPGITRRSRTGFKALFVASDSYRKGTRTVFEAWTRVRRPGDELICVTSRDLFASPLLVRMLMEQPSIIWHPFMPHSRLQRLYDDVDCVLQPSHEDGYPAAVTDGMARGIAAIVSDRSGVNDLIADGESGFVVSPGDAAAVADALGRMMASRSLVRRMGEAARDAAAASSWARFAVKLASAIEGDA